MAIDQLFHFRLHRDSPLSLIFSLACWLLLAAAFSFRTARVFRMEVRSCCLSFLAVNSLNACSRLSACLDLKITIYRGGWVVRSFRKVKSMSYFLAQGLNRPMLASVISMLDRAEPSFLSCRSSAGRDGPYPSLSAGRTDIFGWPLAALGR